MHNFSSPVQKSIKSFVFFEQVVIRMGYRCINESDKDRILSSQFAN